jgi:hypothetical protein
LKRKYQKKSFSYLCLYILIATYKRHYFSGVVIDCYRTTVDDYNGHQQTTKTGEPCIRWDSIYNKDYKNEQFVDTTISDAANFCRAVGENYLWCWTEVGDRGKCGIEKCGK